MDITRFKDMKPDLTRCIHKKPYITRFIDLKPDLTRFIHKNTDITRFIDKKLSFVLNTEIRKQGRK